MKLFHLFVMVLAVMAFVMGSQGAPKGRGGGLKKGLKAIGKGVRVVGAVGTGHEMYESVKNRHNQG